MAESRPHRRAKRAAAGRGGATEVPLPSGRRLDALSGSGTRATEVETSGRQDRYAEAIERLQESGASDLVLRVPQRHMDDAADALRVAGVEGRVQNMHNTKGFKVRLDA